MCESSRCRRTLNNDDTCITLCTSTPWCKQQPRVLSPSVFLFCQRQNKNPPPSSEGAEAAPPQSTDLALLSKFGVNAIIGRGYNPSVFCPKGQKNSSPYTGEPRFALRLTRWAQGSRDLRSVATLQSLYTEKVRHFCRTFYYIIFSAYFTTKFTSLPGTTISLIIVLPSSSFAAASFAAARQASLSAPAGTVIRALIFPQS